MPIISLISIPLLYQHYQALEQLRAQHLPFIQLPGRFALLILFSGSALSTQVLAIFIGLATIPMQLMFLEAFWQTYHTSRARTYASSMLAWAVSGIIVTFGVGPLRDFVVYLAGN